MAAASIAIVLFVVASVLLNTIMYFQCSSEDNCNPFGGESVDETVANAEDATEVIGTAAQFMLSTEIRDGQNMFPASQKYAYCRDGPGEVGQYRCTNAPEGSEITDAADSFSRYSLGAGETITNLLPFLDGIDYAFTLSQDDETLLETGDISQSHSTFIFRSPIAGGETIRLTLEISRGNTAVGVVEQ